MKKIIQTNVNANESEMNSSQPLSSSHALVGLGNITMKINNNNKIKSTLKIILFQKWSAVAKKCDFKIKRKEKEFIDEIHELFDCMDPLPLEL